MVTPCTVVRCLQSGRKARSSFTNHHEGLDPGCLDDLHAPAD